MGEREDVRKGNKPARVGDCVRLTFEISNERNNPLQHFCLTDSNLGDGCLECAEESGATSAIIPRGTFVCHVDYKVPYRRATIFRERGKEGGRERATMKWCRVGEIARS